MSASSFCPFCRIAAEPAVAATVLQSPLALAFLDIRPMRPGHALVVPRRHESDFWRLTADEHAEMLALARQLAQAQQALFNPLRAGLLVAGFDVAHAHLHVIPLHEATDLTLNPQLMASLGMAPAEELARQKGRFDAHFAAAG